MAEQWKTCVYDGVVYENYEVSTHGRVKSLNYNRTGEIKIMQLNLNGRKYFQVRLRKNNEKKTCLVHRLVAEAFIPNPNNLPLVNHINEDKTDNRVENLEWCTESYNVSYGTSQKRRVEAIGKKVKCVETGIIYCSTQECARQTGLSQSRIWECCVGKRKTCGGYHWEYI